jgi:serine/threonine protein kinase
MKLKTGTLRSLIEESNQKPLGDDLETIAWDVCCDTLTALDFLVSKNTIHRDVKPENILYISVPQIGDRSPYRFQLGGFGLSNRSTADAIANVHSRAFMAPEMTQDSATQTTKVDVWSLFVTIIWAMDLQGYRKAPFTAESFPDSAWDEKASNKGQDTYEKQNLQAILDASRDPKVFQVRHMATLDSEKRPSAAQMIVELLDGRGLSTSWPSAYHPAAESQHGCKADAENRIVEKEEKKEEGPKVLELCDGLATPRSQVTLPLPGHMDVKTSHFEPETLQITGQAENTGRQPKSTTRRWQRSAHPSRKRISKGTCQFLGSGVTSRKRRERRHGLRPKERAGNRQVSGRRWKFLPSIPFQTSDRQHRGTGTYTNWRIFSLFSFLFGQ